MGRNLTNLYISESFQYLTQVSGSELQTGLGAPITSLTITSSYAVSSSYSNASISSSYAATATSSSFAINANNAVSASYALTASYALNAGASVNTGSLLVTASAVSNTITFTKGDGSTFPVVVATGSGGGSVNTGSLLVTASISNATTTYTKGDGSTFALTVNNVVNASSASVATSASIATTASYVASVVSASYALSASQAANATSASYAATATSSSYSNTSTSSSYAATATSSSYAINATSASYALSSSRAVSSSRADSALSSSYALSASWAPSAGGGAAYGFQALSTGSNYPLFTFSDTSSASGLPITFVQSIGTPTYLWEAPFNSGSLYASYNLSIKNAQYYNDSRGGQGNLVFGGLGHTITDGGGFGSVLNPQYLTMIGGNANNFGSGVGMTGFVFIGGQGNDLNKTYSANQNKIGATMIGGYSNYLGGSNGGVLIGGYGNQAKSGVDASVILAGHGNTMADYAAFSAILGASNSTQNSGYGGIIGGYYNVNSGDYNAYIYGGQENEIKSGTYNNNTILGGCNNTIYAIPQGGPSQFEPGTTIIGGRFNSISGSTHFSTIVGGYQNLMLHSGSVILGGRSITSSAHNTTFVPNLKASGSGDFRGKLVISQSQNDYTAGAFELYSERNGQSLITMYEYGGQAYIKAPRANGYMYIEGGGGANDGVFINQTILAYPSAGAYNRANGVDISANTRITGSLVISGSAQGTVIPLTITSNTASMDCSKGNFFTLTLQNGSGTYVIPTNIQPGQTVNLQVSQPVSGGIGPMALAPSVLQPSGSIYAPSSTNGAIDLLTMISFTTSSLLMTATKKFV